MSKDSELIRSEIGVPSEELYSIDTNIPVIAEEVFSAPVAPACSFGLQLETDVNDGPLADQARTIFEILMTLTLKGMRVKYGDDADPRRLSPQQIGTLKEYMRSFGWEFSVTSTPEDEDIENKRLKFTPENIEWYRLRLPDPKNKMKHDIAFTAYIPPQIGSVLR